MKRKSNKSKLEAQPTQVEHCSLLSGECDIEDSDSVDSEDSDTAEASSLLPIGLHYFVSFHRNKSELSKAQIIKYYFNRQSLPCLPTSLLDKSSSNNSVVALLLNAEQCYKEFIATSNPVRVKHNVRFLINLDELNDCEDLLSDDLGSWNQTKTKKKWYETRCDINGKLNSLTEKWDRKEFKDSPEELAFSKYFRRYKAEEIWNHVTAKSIQKWVLRTKYKPTTFQSQQMLFSNDGKTSKPQTWPVLSRIVGASSPNSDVMFNGHCWGFQARIY
ncbi:unnamed protein product [Porites lobata]|uniref:Uncharacterized protein n=1 Tax=Porites lobata TaxID=104759 RepID=A0ABN8NTJ4_9CNID|nr:unnamed protein product [Porites lobata]